MKTLKVAKRRYPFIADADLNIQRWKSAFNFSVNIRHLFFPYNQSKTDGDWPRLRRGAGHFKKHPSHPA
jgi:hypothetical protein